MNLEIGLATLGDAPRLLEIHIAAVHQTAASYYPKEILNCWSNSEITEKRIHNVQERWIRNTEYRVLVARKDGEVIGFGMIDTSSVLQAVYVHPKYGRMGVGSQILLALERKAKKIGLTHLDADASMNAKYFYTSKGFQVLEYSSYQLRSGDKMACVKMTKNL